MLVVVVVVVSRNCRTFGSLLKMPVCREEKEDLVVVYMPFSSGWSALLGYSTRFVGYCSKVSSAGVLRQKDEVEIPPLSLPLPSFFFAADPFSGCRSRGSVDSAIIIAVNSEFTTTSRAKERLLSELEGITWLNNSAINAPLLPI